MMAGFLAWGVGWTVTGVKFIAEVSAWKTTVDGNQLATDIRQDRLETAQSGLVALTGQHEGRIVRVETQVIAIERLEGKVDRLLSQFEPQRRGSATAIPPPWLPR